jgi:hypothetical protein
MVVLARIGAICVPPAICDAAHAGGRRPPPQRQVSDGSLSLPPGNTCAASPPAWCVAGPAGGRPGPPCRRRRAWRARSAAARATRGNCAGRTGAGTRRAVHRPGPGPSPPAPRRPAQRLRRGGQHRQAWRRLQRLQRCRRPEHTDRRSGGYRWRRAISSPAIRSASALQSAGGSAPAGRRWSPPAQRTASTCARSGCRARAHCRASGRLSTPRSPRR